MIGHDFERGPNGITTRAVVALVWSLIVVITVADYLNGLAANLGSLDFAVILVASWLLSLRATLTALAFVAITRVGLWATGGLLVGTLEAQLGACVLIAVAGLYFRNPLPPR